MPATPNLQQIIDEVRTEVGWVGVGVCNCRKKRGSSSWSHHAWCNAGDFMVGNDKELGDRIAAFLVANRNRLGIYRILWYGKSLFTGNTISGHRDHLHVVPYPYGIGTPPCAGGTLYVRNRDGSKGTSFGEATESPGYSREEQEVRELVAVIQEALINAGYDLGDFEGYLSPDGKQFPDGADGLMGRVTKDALTEAFGTGDVLSGTFTIQPV